MLKALELIGFKSFADKTRFEFPSGITVVVGPNGSGKSNVVDAIKWVLGEQSAKSLRGRDMSDVIFKGTGSGGRRVLNTAEVTIVFDNSGGHLAIDASEVNITRRVYRSGEGEYLLNRQPCRLRDIRDLFRGTGVGADAYSLIEQGKVDQLLQASPKERRAIFEEAAGISRFKAKKIEAQRRLERVDQNLLRLSDLVEEVESRLRSVRSQASKAQRYQEYSERLQKLRTQIGLTDWRKLSQKLEGYESQLNELSAKAQELVAQSELGEAESLELDLTVSNCGEAIRSWEARIAGNRESIASRESTIANQRTRCHDLEEEASRYRSQLAILSSRADDVKELLEELTLALKNAQSEHHLIQDRLSTHELAFDRLTDQLKEIRGKNEDRRNEHVEKMQKGVEVANRIGSLEAKIKSAQQQDRQQREQLQELQLACSSLEEQLKQLSEEQEKLVLSADEKETLLKAARSELSASRHSLANRQEELSRLQQRFGGASERATILEELEKRREGLSSGVKDVLAQFAQNTQESEQEVCGLVADLISAAVETASMVDVALGESSQFVVLRTGRLLERIKASEIQLKGRVGFVRLDTASLAPVADHLNLEEREEVLGRADRVVHFDAEFEPLVRRLLGQTWFVKTLADAIRLRESVGQGLRFVTTAGELLDSNDTLVVGPRHTATGLVSRRSELRALQEEIKILKDQIVQSQKEVQQLQLTIDQQDQSLESLAVEHKAAEKSLADHCLQSNTLQERFQQFDKQRTTIEEELSLSEAQQQGDEGLLETERLHLAELESVAAEMQSLLKADDQKLEQLDQQKQACRRDATAAKIELAKSEQRLESQRVHMIRSQADQRERDKAIEQATQQLSSSLQRRVTAERTILKATSEVAEFYLQKEQFAKQVVGEVNRREELIARRVELGEQLQKMRRQAKKIDTQQHELELSAGEVRHQRGGLASRLREDYGIELSQLEHQPTAQEQQERAEVEEEIASLRRKINNIGAVNMSAVAELDELDERFGTLSGQYQDLTNAKETLERIIQKINVDSSRLFSETLDTIRTNFKALYRKAFGGGNADIVLEEGVDILECGIEIVATPPGKPTFNNSLLSGGEKALTAVALLLAIFQFRPSPFCVLDEVDAPFDEANIERFINMLTDFLGWTKFVIVTHSKKTMTAADTLYGITMQESGVSKRVSVKFDDVREDGHLSQDAQEGAPREDQGVA